MLDAKVFLKLLQLDLKAHPPGAPIRKVRLSAEPAQPRTLQGGLFLAPTPEPEKLELTLARIAGMVGKDKVGSLQLLDSHHPEAFRMQRFVPAAPKGQKRNWRQLLPRLPLLPCACFVRLCAPRLHCAMASLSMSSAQKEKKCRERFFGSPAHGALQETGGNKMDGRTMNGISLCPRKLNWLFIGWCMTCWRRMVGGGMYD